MTVAEHWSICCKDESYELMVTVPTGYVVVGFDIASILNSNWELVFELNKLVTVTSTPSI